MVGSTETHIMEIASLSTGESPDIRTQLEALAFLGMVMTQATSCMYNNTTFLNPDRDCS
jgi:hypothetical protein